MFVSIRKLPVVKLIYLPILLLGVISALTWGAIRSSSLARGKGSVVPSLTAQKTPINPADRVEVELITLTARGFSPQQITRTEGKFLLAVEPRLEGGGTVTLRLSNQATNVRLKEQGARAGQNGWTNLFDLPAGQYVLTVAENPNWACQLTLSPK